MTERELMEELDYYKRMYVLLSTALDSACYELECADGTIKDFNDRLDNTYYEIKDRQSWREKIIKDVVEELNE